MVPSGQLEPRKRASAQQALDGCLLSGILPRTRLSGWPDLAAQDGRGASEVVEEFGEQRAGGVEGRGAEALPEAFFLCRPGVTGRGDGFVAAGGERDAHPNVRTTVRYHQAVSRFAVGEELAAFFHPDAVHTWLPNALFPDGTVRPLPDLIAAVQQVLRARIAAFLEFRDGKIIAQRNYDCYERLSPAAPGENGGVRNAWALEVS